MSEQHAVKILIVDDQTSNLDALEAMLDCIIPPDD